MTLWAMLWFNGLHLESGTHILCHWEHETLRTTTVDLCKQVNKASDADTDTFYELHPTSFRSWLEIDRDGKYRSRIDSNTGVVTKGSMTSDSSYVIMVPEEV
jgi:hypothetical protein